MDHFNDSLSPSDYGILEEDSRGEYAYFERGKTERRSISKEEGSWMISLV